MPGSALTNWAGNVTFGAAQVRRPTTVDQVRALASTGLRVRVVGAAHSFSPVADTEGLQLSLVDLPPIVDLDTSRAQVKVAAGLRYGDIVEAIDAAGLALPNLASLPHLSVAGAVATGTHGSGLRNPGLASAVSSVELVTATGDLVEVDRSDPSFPGAVVSLGRLGAVVSLTLDLVPSFRVRQVVYTAMPLDAVRAHLSDVLARAYSVSLFTRWLGDSIDQVWVKARVGDDVGSDEPFETEWLGARLADQPMHMVPDAPARRCTEQLGIEGPWYDRLPHFRLHDVPSSGDELQSEYLLPVERAAEALEAVGRIGAVVAPVLQVSEVRTVAADEQWLSPAYQQDSVAIHFTWVRDTDRVLPAVRAVEAGLLPLGARPHWGKVFVAEPAAVRARYARLDDFAVVVAAMDPDSRFGNAFTDRYLG